MLYIAFSKSWWKSLVSGEEGGEGDPNAPKDMSGVESPEMGSAEFTTEMSAENSMREEGEWQGAADTERRGGEAAEERNERDDEEDDDDDVDENDFDAFENEDSPVVAFDLDAGAPVSREREREERRPPRRSGVIDSAKEFFAAELLYRFDILEPEIKKKHEGSYRFEIKGSQGGVWTVLLRENLEVLNRREEADVVVSVNQDDFVDVVNGDINPQLAMLAKKLKLSGDINKGITLIDLLAPYYD